MGASLYRSSLAWAITLRRTWNAIRLFHVRSYGSERIDPPWAKQVPDGVPSTGGLTTEMGGSARQEACMSWMPGKPGHFSYILLLRWVCPPRVTTLSSHSILNIGNAQKYGQRPREYQGV